MKTDKPISWDELATEYDSAEFCKISIGGNSLLELDGILHDYDLMANQEASAKQHTCVICNASPTTFQWSDYSGQAMCTKCGCPYQLKWGTEEQVKEGKYPYLALKEEFIPVVKEYFDQTGRFTCLGVMLGARPGVSEFVAWVKEKYPELLEGGQSR